MLYAIPLTILPWIAFNVVAFVLGYDVWDRQLFSVTMISGQPWAFFVRDLMILFLVEFIVVRLAAHSVFFVLMVIALFDVIAGFTIAIKTAQRGVTYTREADSPR